MLNLSFLEETKEEFHGCTVFHVPVGDIIVKMMTLTDVQAIIENEQESKIIHI